MLWKLRAGIGERLPEDRTRQESFGLVENEQLSSTFTAQTVLLIMDFTSDGDKIVRIPEGDISSEADRARMRIFDGIPEHYTLYVPFASLETLARNWLGWPFDKAAMPKANAYSREGEKGLFIDMNSLFECLPPVSRREAFALPSSLYREGEVWIIGGEVWSPHQPQGDIWRIEKREPFLLRVQKIDDQWRILFLDFSGNAPQ